MIHGGHGVPGGKINHFFHFLTNLRNFKFSNTLIRGSRSLKWVIFRHNPQLGSAGTRCYACQFDFEDWRRVGGGWVDGLVGSILVSDAKIIIYGGLREIPLASRSKETAL